MASTALRGIHYSQQTRNAGSYTFNKGEDTLPFVNDEFMLVADGLGGDGFFTHTRMNPLMWNKKERRNLFDVPENDAELKSYFDGLFEEMDRESIEGQKPARYIEYPKHELHSGYYGSRITSYAFVSLLKQDARFMPCHLFQALDSAKDDIQYLKILDDYSASLCDALVEKIKLFAKRGNFVLESDRNSAKLLPTTLTAAIYRNRGEETQVICLWAGDSRIVAQLADGCIQLTADDEKDEGMTNLISLSIKPHINVKEYRFKGPFALFAVSDGTFDDMGGSLCFEAMVILDAMSSESQDAMQEMWTKLFAARSTDDSATIAYYFFGMDSMEASQSFCSARIAEINEKYISLLPDLFSSDFEIELQRLKRKTKNTLRPFQDAIKADPHIVETYAEDEQKSPSQTYAQALREIDTEKRKLDGERTRIFQQIRSYYEQNWLKYRPVSPDHHLNELADQLQDILIRRDSIKGQYKQKLKTMKRDAAYIGEELTKQLVQGEQAADNSILSCSREGMEEDRIEAILTCIKRIGIDLERFSRGKWEETKEYYGLEKSIARVQEELCAKEAEIIDQIARQAVLEEDPGVVTNMPDMVQQSRMQIQKLNEQEQQLEEKRKTALAEASRKRAEESMGSLLDDLVNGSGLQRRLSDSLRSQLDEILDAYHHEASSLQSKMEMQKKIFAACDKRYMRFIQEG